ncbi:extracellular serine protease [Geomicrobium sp. JCM 19037]|nr:extracellular serine protease [Geomicrobium sp. JCM 19037]
MKKGACYGTSQTSNTNDDHAGCCFLLLVTGLARTEAMEVKSSYIVQFHEDVEDEEELLADVLQNVTPDFVYDQSIRGLAYSLTAEQAQAVKAVRGVTSVDAGVDYEVSLRESVPFIGADDLRSELDHRGVKLTGKGVKVGVIDTGIDYTHPDLSRNYKGGYDVVDDDDDPMESKVKGKAQTFHGTHVSGIIAANGSVKGVAPDAELYVYRALGPEGQGSTAYILDAIERAIDDGLMC